MELFVVGCVALLIIDRIAGKVRGRNRKEWTGRIEYVCGCEHAFAFHGPETGSCHGKVEEVDRYNQFGAAISWKKVQCTCRRYDGLQHPTELGLPG